MRPDPAADGAREAGGEAEAEKAVEAERKPCERKWPRPESNRRTEVENLVSYH